VNETRSYNALGYIYYTAPDYFETDPVAISKYGAIRRDYAKAKSYFIKSAALGSPNALYNLGSMQLNAQFVKDNTKKKGKDTDSVFSFTKAYDYFRQAAERGHTFAAYNVAIMHLLGVGTFESC
jgi:TPR repeat protein